MVVARLARTRHKLFVFWRRKLRFLMLVSACFTDPTLESYLPKKRFFGPASTGV